ncbi:F-box only protein 7-like [Anticarsia gemmatalis]|uniref:F-box only protein 7-like n=1 Tax=Anticarsia gemmatalis TaxID=129554 RepID=UPI003F765361
MDVTLEESTTERVTALLHETVRRILNEKQTPDSVQKDLLFMLIVVLMIENGFLPVNDKLEVINLMETFNTEQLSKWKMPTGICEAPFVMSGFKNVTLKLLMSPLGATVLVNVVANELNFETYSICIPVSRYVVSPQATSIPMIFRDLKHFSITFKNKVLSAVKSRILTHYGYASASLSGLPDEVLINIMLNLPVSDIVNMGKTCTRMKSVLENQSLWHLLNKRDFQNGSDIDIIDWKGLYMKNYAVQQDANIRTRRMMGGSMHDYMDYSDYVSYIDNPMWNIIF